MTSPHAQEAAGSSRSLALTFNQDYRATENAGLDPVSAGVTQRAATRLGVSAEIEDEITSLQFNTSTALTFSRLPDGATTEDIQDPQLRLSYTRTGAINTLFANVRLRSEEIAFIRPLEDFLDEDGNLDLPEDALDLEATGRRNDLSLSLGATLRRDAPLSFTVSAGTDRRRYTDVTDPSLFDRTTDRAAVSARLAIDPLTSLSLGWSGSFYNAEDADRTRRDQQSLNLGFSRTLSEVLDLTASVGVSRLDSEENGVETREESGTVSLGLRLARPNGDIGFNYSTALTPSGRRESASLSRSLVLPTANLSATLGLTRLEGAPDVDPTVSVSYSQSLPSGSVSIGLSQSVRYDEARDEDRTASSVSASYSHTIDAVSSISLRGAFSQTEDVDQANLSVSYARTLTEDWSLSTSYSYRTRTEAGATGDSHSVFFGIGRRFDLPF